mmetsp:Transcript_2376/g.4825  ORF Transcript_2376/g.4825 Transcript_2376/m.4825 type:complete len:249 (-) Transcript_2376:21-767(-)
MIVRVHEKQVRQLCGVHLVNNLLQLEENTTSEGREWFCRGNLLDNAVLGEKKWFAATQEELDSIAVRLTWLEQQLMQGGSVDAEDHRQPKLAILERIRSQHACPYLGNYSFEVVTEALGRRGVGLQFVRPAEVEEERVHKEALGYVIHLQGGRSPFSALRLLNHIGSYFFGSGKHWLAITAVRCMGDSGFMSSKKPDESWLLIDSKSPDPIAFKTKAELAHYLKNVQRNGGMVFKAFLMTEAHEDETK